MRGWRWAVAAGMWALAVASPATAQDAPPSPPSSDAALAALAEAEAKANEYLFEEALARADVALQEGGLARAPHARALWVRAHALAALNRPDEARAGFIRALAVDPTRPIDPMLGPRIRTPFYRARSFWRGQPRPAGLTIAAIEAGDGRALRVTLVDPLTWATRVELAQRVPPEQGFAARRAPVAGAPWITPAVSADGVLEVYARATDARDNVIFEVGTPAHPVRTTARLGVVGPPPAPPADVAAPSAIPPLAPEETSVFESPVFWIVTGVVVTAAAVTVPVALSL